MRPLAKLALVTLLTAYPALAAEAPRLIPFQGRLTDQQGVPYTNGQFTVLFQLYADPVGATPLWSERHEKVGVLNGTVNIFLGSIRSLANVSFSETRHLGITIDADNNPNTPDPEMVPRQMIIPAFWAKQADNSLNSAKLNSYDWTHVFGINNPTGPIPATKLADGSIPGAKLMAGSISSAQIAPNSIVSDNIASGGIITSSLADGAVTLPKLATRQIGTNFAAVGGIAFSQPTPTLSISLSSTTEKPITNLSLTLATSGRPVVGFLTSVNPNDAPAYLGPYRLGKDCTVAIRIYRSTTLIYRTWLQITATGATATAIYLPPSCVQFIDTPPAGTNTYSLTVSGVDEVGGSVFDIQFARLVAFEL